VREDLAPRARLHDDETQGILGQAGGGEAGSDRGRDSGMGRHGKRNADHGRDTAGKYRHQALHFGDNPL